MRWCVLLYTFMDPSRDVVMVLYMSPKHNGSQIGKHIISIDHLWQNSIMRHAELTKNCCWQSVSNGVTSLSVRYNEIDGVLTSTYYWRERRELLWLTAEMYKSHHKSNLAISSRHSWFKNVWYIGNIAQIKHHGIQRTL